MTSKEMPTAIIFDFDGVILESADIKTQAFLDLFSEYPEHLHAIRRYHLDNVGISRYRKFQWIYSELLGQPLDEDQSRRLGKAFSDIALEKVLTCAYVPGALECLGTLSGSSQLFVASGTPQEELDLIVDRRNLGHYFMGVYGTPQTKVEIIEGLLGSLGLSPDEVVFIGDGISDHQAASETGVRFIARESPTPSVEWSALGVPVVSDLYVLLHFLGCGIRARSLA